MATFHDARLKIERANEHITNLNTIISSMPDAYSIAIERDKNTGTQKAKYAVNDLEKFGPRLALIIGDAIHNLRTALDYAWIAVIAAHTTITPDRHTKFPFYDSREGLEGVLKGRKIDTACSELYDLVVS